MNKRVPTHLVFFNNEFIGYHYTGMDINDWEEGSIFTTVKNPDIRYWWVKKENTTAALHDFEINDSVLEKANVLLLLL